MGRISKFCLKVIAYFCFQKYERNQKEMHKTFTQIIACINSNLKKNVHVSIEIIHKKFFSCNILLEKQTKKTNQVNSFNQKIIFSTYECHKAWTKYCLLIAKEILLSQRLHNQFMDTNLLDLISTPIVFDSLKVDKPRYIRKKILNFLLVLLSQ